jgi:hypothetical protein
VSPSKGRYPDNVEGLEDAPQATRIVREHTYSWHIDPNRIGVIGFLLAGILPSCSARIRISKERMCLPRRATPAPISRWTFTQEASSPN